VKQSHRELSVEGNTRVTVSHHITAAQHKQGHTVHNQSEEHTHRPSAQSKLDGVQVRDGAPHLSDQTLLRDVDVAQVERVVDGLHLPHLDEPHTHGLGGGLQHSLTVVLGLVQHLQQWQRGDICFRLQILVQATRDICSGKYFI